MDFCAPLDETYRERTPYLEAIAWDAETLFYRVLADAVQRMTKIYLKRSQRSKNDSSTLTNDRVFAGSTGKDVFRLECVVSLIKSRSRYSQWRRSPTLPGQSSTNAHKKNFMTRTVTRSEPKSEVPLYGNRQSTIMVRRGGDVVFLWKVLATPQFRIAVKDVVLGNESPLLFALCESGWLFDKLPEDNYLF